MMTMTPTLLAIQTDGRLFLNEPMVRRTSLHLGGNADMLASVKSVEEIRALLSDAKEQGVRVTIIGKGNNLLVLDGGIRGLTILIDGDMSGIRQEGQELMVQGGASMAAIAQAAAKAALTGLEFASGIPGTVGGGIYMNAGAYDGEMKNVVKSVSGLTKDGTPFTYTGDEMGFGYRHSRAQDEGLIITEATLSLSRGNTDAIKQKMADFNARRREKQPLTDLSCGSTFKRPEGYFAGTLIEQCGLKGFRIGQCEVSKKHAGFLINHEGGTAKDFLALIAHVQKTVYEQTGVSLKPEVCIIGEDAQITLV